MADVKGYMQPGHTVEDLDTVIDEVYEARGEYGSLNERLNASTGGNYSITVLWDYITDNSSVIPYEPFIGTLHDNINNYDAILLEVASSSGDLDNSDWDSTMFSSIIPVYVLNNSFKNNYFNFTSFGERSSRWYIKDTTVQKTTTNIGNTNGLVRVYGIKF